MADKTISPTIAAKAGNAGRYEIAKATDPVYIALAKWNGGLVLGIPPKGQEEPRDDNRAYAVEGFPQPLCRPFVNVSWITAGFQPGPEVSFQQRDDGLHLVVAFVEEPAKRAAGAVPFAVTVKWVQLKYGSDPTDVLNFTDLLQEPLDAASGPAFRIEADALVPLERRARIVAAMQQRGAASWIVTMEFQWTRIIPQPQPEPRPHRPDVVVRPHGGVTVTETVRPRPRPWGTKPHIKLHQRDEADQGQIVNAQLHTTFIGRQEMLHAVLVQGHIWQPPPPRTETVTYPVVRTLTAEYPKDAPENRPIFAAIDGDYVQIGWKNTAHGWFQPTPIQDTVYTLPHAYRLQVDSTTGRPSIQAVLLRKNDAGEMVDDLDPKHYKVRLTLTARPDFDPARLTALRALVRAESNNHVKYADLVLGGYAAARFVPDPALAGLGELFAGSSAGVRDSIDPSEGFTLTYDGNAEFIDLLFQRLKGEGIQGQVELDLLQPGGATQKHSVPVVLTLRRRAPVPLPWTFHAPAPPAEGAAPQDLLPRDLEITNPTSVDVVLGGVTAHALQKSPITGRVEEWYAARPDGAWPRTLAPGAREMVRLTIEGESPLYNAWDVALVDAQTRTSEEIVLNQIFDAATSGVRGWKVQVDCPPFAFFDQLPPEDQATMRDVIAIEVELRRAGSQSIEEVRLTKGSPQGAVLLSRTVADFVSDRANGRSSFEYRQRTLRFTRADEWTPWRPETGSAITIFLQ